jgi:aryl-alcohol dehydrogenase-like predicted oxidoreductase
VISQHAQKTSIGTVSSANADALLLIVQMRKFTQLTALRFALAFLLKTRKTSAALANISTMLNANASVHHKFAP